MTIIRLTITRTETFTVETTESDIRDLCVKNDVPANGYELDGIMSSLTVSPTYPEELVLAALVGETEPDGEDWDLWAWQRRGRRVSE